MRIIAACVIAALAHAASADPPPPAQDPYGEEPNAPRPAPERARGWEREPAESHVVVLGGIGRGLRHTGGFLVAVVAAPFRGLAWLEDHHRVLTRTKNLFYNRDHTAGVLPALTLESGFGVQVGATAFHKDLFGHGERVAASATYGGENRYASQLKLELRDWFDARGYLAARLRYESSDDLLFAGIGNRSDGRPFAPAGETRYGERRALGTISAGAQRLAPATRLRAGFTYIYNDRAFDQDVRSTATPIGDVYDVMALAGFDGVRLHEVTGDVDFDTRDHTGRSGAGMHANAFVGGAFGTVAGQPGTTAFTHWGAELTGYMTPWRERRVFLVRLVHEGVEGSDIPFTDLPRLGGAGLLRGFSRDEFRDELAVVATLEYRYPIQNSISGTLFVESGKVGRTYDQLMKNFGDNWHTGYGGGLIVHSAESIGLTIQVAYGDAFQLYVTTDVWQAFKKRGREL